MHSTTNSSIKHSIYKAHESDTLMSEVTRVVCILMPRASLIAGLNTENEVCIIRSHSYGNTYEAWHQDFFATMLTKDPLLGDLSILPSVFIAAEKQIIVPAALYDQQEAGNWLTSQFFVSPDELIHHCDAPADNAFIVYAQPAMADKLVKTYFNHAALLPVNIYQHCGTPAGDAVQCLITENEVFASLRRKGKLTWHQAFSYTNAEEIVYQLGLMCKQYNIKLVDLNLQCAATETSCMAIIQELATFFPHLRYDHVVTDAADKDWAPVIYLVQQLNACAS
ncbi:DUF3822 family protein [Chitinophagaceae bacterium MMS25-I14]